MTEEYVTKIEKEVDRLEDKVNNLLDVISHLNSLNLKIGISSFYPYITPEGILNFVRNPKNGWTMLSRESDFYSTYESYKNEDKFIKLMVECKNQEAVQKSFADAFAIIYNVHCDRNQNKDKILFLLELIKGEPV